MTSPPPRLAPPPRRRPRRGRFGRFLFALVALPVLAALLLGLSAAYVGGGWAVQLVAIGLPYAAWTGTVLALAALLAGRRGWALALALPVALVALRAWPGSADAPQPGDLVVTSFNVPPVERRTVRADSMAAFAARGEPHLLAMQDTWVYPAGTRDEQPAHVRSVVERGPYRLAAPSRLVPREGWQRRGTGTPLLVRTRARSADTTGGRVEVLAQEEIDLSRDGDASLALRTRFRWQGREAVLYNVHLRSFGQPRPWSDPAVDPLDPATWRPYVRRYRAVYADRHAETDRLVARIAQETLPVLVAGDLNSTADQYAVRRLRRARRGAPFIDAYARAGGWRWGRTYHARRPLVRIDFVFADPEAFRVTGARTYPVGFSDHRPVEVRLRWRDAAPADSTGG